MPTTATIRLNVHITPGSGRLAWGLLAITENSQGVRDARLMRHGACDLTDHDLVGIEAVVQALAVAVDQEA